MDSINSNMVKDCDRESKIYCKSFNNLLPQIQSISELNDIDLSALGLYLCKCIEQEINSSIIQLMRYYLGIDMPEFYGIVDPGFPFKAANVYKDGNMNARPINLNEYLDQRNHKGLKMIPIGEAYHVMVTLVDEDRDAFVDYPFLFNYKFREDWRAIMVLRNQIAHPGTIIKRKRIEECYDKCMAFMNNYMPKLVEIKNDLAPKDRPAQEEIDIDYSIKPINESQNDNMISDSSLSISDIAIAEKNGKLGLLRQPSGEELTPFVYDNICRLYGLFSPYFFFRINGCESYGLMDGRGKEIIPCIIDEYYEISNTAGLHFRSGDKFGYYSFDYKLLVPPIYDEIIFEDIDLPFIFVIDGVRGCIDSKGIFYTKEYLERMETDKSLPYVEAADLLTEWMP